MDHRLGEFVEKLQTIEGLPALEQHIKHSLCELGLDWFGYVGMDLHAAPPRSRTRFITVPHITINVAPSQWVERYAEQNYYSDDPVILESLRTIVPFRWDDAAKRKHITRTGRRVMNEASECGLKSGLTIPVLAHGGKFGLLSVSSKERLAELEMPNSGLVHMVHVMSIYFHVAVQKHIAEFQSLPHQALLRPRELECLLWTARGKSAWEVSMILKVSERTVNFHLGNAMRKLGVYNKTHAVAKMLMLGLAKP